MHAIETPDKGSLSASGWADYSCDHVLLYLHRNVLQDLFGSEPSVQVLDFNFVTHLSVYPYFSLVMYLTMVLIKRTIRIRIKDAPQALGKSMDLNGDWEKLKIVSGRAAVG